ncbi:MAG TPA: metalloregulator ArsR/SmtB family transcription factor [Vicinamibacterales bacterium]|nr:metalloregulator ArsR/SmtB family transcription factor [Vicinamibacterales bacterium]
MAETLIERPRAGRGEPVPRQPEPDRCDVPHVDRARVEATRATLLGPEAAQAVAETFKVLGDLTRVRLIDALAQGEHCVCDLAALVGLSESAVSHQLRLLRSMRLVRSRRAGRMVFYSLDDQHILGLFRQAAQHVEESGPRA